MHGYYFGYGVNGILTNNVAAVSPVPQPPNIVAMTTPLPVQPTAPPVMLAVSHPSVAMVTPVPEPPNRMVFLGPQPEPPDIALKRYKDYLAELKGQAGQKEQFIEKSAGEVMLAIFNTSWAMGTPMPIPPSMPVFLSPQPEPPDKAFKRYKNYVLALRESTDLYIKCIDETLTLCEKLEQELCF
jgi:hypothetical protein